MGSKFSKNVPQKQKKMRKCPETTNFWHVWCIGVTKSVSPEFCHSCKGIFCSFFENEDGWEAKKSWNSVQSGFCVKNAFFSHQMTKLIQLIIG